MGRPPSQLASLDAPTRVPRRASLFASPQGCQVRRESQEKLALCCHGVTALLNESHHELVIDVPLPPETASAEEYRALDKMLCGLDARVHAALSSKA